MAKNIYLSFIIPAYNEEKIIESTLEKVLKFLSKKRYLWEIIVVDDGSDDNTKLKTQNLKVKLTTNNLRVLSHKRNLGKGAAIKTGIKVAKGNFIIFSDADLSVPITNIDKFLTELKKADVVIGSRRTKGAKILTHQPWLRESLGRGYTFLTKFITGVNLSDFTCGFKGFTQKAAKEIFSKTLIDRWAYDSEILFLAKSRHYNIYEYPVTWTNRKDTRVRLGGAIFESLRDLVRIRINAFQGKYD